MSWKLKSLLTAAFLTLTSFSCEDYFRNGRMVVPDVHMMHYQEQKDTTLYDYVANNKVTLVNIWGTWCGPCIEEMPEIRYLYDHYDRGDVAVVGITDPAAHGTKKGLDRLFKHVMVPNYDILYLPQKDESMVDYFPTSFIVASDSTIVKVWEGKIPTGQVKHTIDSLLSTSK